MKLLSSCLMLLAALVPNVASSEEIRIGHLETADDTGINWLFFHCNQARQTLNCTIFQTLVFTDRKSATCSVHNDFSETAFRWNQATQTWVSQEGPIGPCGRITVGNLDHDPEEPRFWRYIEKHVTTNPEGMLGNLACKSLPDITLHYTWKATRNKPGCTYVENLMN